MIPGATPGADDGTGRYRNVGIPGLLVYLFFTNPSGKGTMAMIVCPGGGYLHLTGLVGASGAMDAFRPKGIAVIALRYRTAPPSTSVDEDALADGIRAVKLVRSHAQQWGIDPNKIGIIGWSAGANLALNVASHFDEGNPNPSDPVEKQSGRPNFVILLSPWPSKKTIANYPIGKTAPPAFIGSAKDDKTAPTAFAQSIGDAYGAAGVAHYLWIIENGGHGAFTFGGPGEGGSWSTRFWPWLSTVGIEP